MVLCFKIITYSKIFIKNRGKLNVIFSQYFSKIMQFLKGVGRGKFRFTSSSIAMYDIIDYFMVIWMRMMKIKCTKKSSLNCLVFAMLNKLSFSF